MLTRADEKYLYKTPDECFPEAYMMLDEAQYESNTRVKIFQFLFGRDGTTIKSDYEIAEARIFLKLMTTAYEEMLRAGIESHEINPAQVDLRALLDDQESL